MNSANANGSQIPVIDLSGALPEAQLAKELVDAVATSGFVYIKNKGQDIPINAIEGIFDMVRLENRPFLESSDVVVSPVNFSQFLLKRSRSTRFRKMSVVHSAMTFLTLELMGIILRTEVGQACMQKH